jgi:hypothetical protein
LIFKILFLQRFALRGWPEVRSFQSEASLVVVSYGQVARKVCDVTEAIQIPNIVAVERSIEVVGAVDQVWNQIGDYGTAGRFLGIDSVMVFGTGQAGSLRQVGDQILELLVARGRFSYTYAQIRGPRASYFYHGHLEVEQLNEQACVIRYILIYEQASMEANARKTEVARLSERFQRAVETMKEHVEAAASGCR